MLCIVITVIILQITVYATNTQIPVYSENTQIVESSSPFDFDEQLDALGKEELQQQVPEQAKELMRKTDTEELSVTKLLQLTPRKFFSTIWQLMTSELKKQVRMLASTVGIIVLCALFGGLKTASGENSLTQIFTTVSVLCVLTSVIKPILDCVIDTSNAIRDAAFFMLSYIPMFSAALTASGSPITGATYNAFLIVACEAISQVVAKTLVPLMGIYLALCICGALVPEIKISSSTSTIKTIVSWALGFFLTIFVGLLSVQTIVAQSADTVTVKATKFMIGSFVPVVGSALSEAYTAAQGCFRLIKASLGAYGIIATAFTFLPVLIRTILWYTLTNIAVIVGDLLGVTRVSEILKACASVLGITIAIILCFALMLIVSTTVVMVTSMGG